MMAFINGAVLSVLLLSLSVDVEALSEDVFGLHKTMVRQPHVLQDTIQRTESNEGDRRLLAGGIDKLFGQSTDSFPLDNDEASSRKLFEVMTALEAAPEWDVEELSGNSLNVAHQPRKSRTLKATEKVEDDDRDSVVNSSPWSQERVISFLLAAVMHVLDSPALHGSKCKGESLKNVHEQLLEAQKQIIQNNFKEARQASIRASNLMKKCHIDLLKGKKVDGLDAKHLRAALKDGLHKISILMATLNSLQKGKDVQ